MTGSSSAAVSESRSRCTHLSTAAGNHLAMASGRTAPCRSYVRPLSCAIGKRPRSGSSGTASAELHSSTKSCTLPTQLFCLYDQFALTAPQASKSSISSNRAAHEEKLASSALNLRRPAITLVGPSAARPRALRLPRVAIAEGGCCCYPRAPWCGQEGASAHGAKPNKAGATAFETPAHVCCECN